MRLRDYFEDVAPQLGNVFVIETSEELTKFHGILSIKFVHPSPKLDKIL